MEEKPKITTGPNERPRNETISQTGPGIPDDTSSPILDVGDEDIERVRAKMTATERDSEDEDDDEDDIPAKFIDCEVNLLSLNPLLGILRMETDGGPMELLIDREDAGILAGTLVEVLSAGDDEDDEDYEEEDEEDEDDEEADRA